jgi:hypothetical protein
MHVIQMRALQFCVGYVTDLDIHLLMIWII